MTPERRRRITDVFHAALARDLGTRAAFLDLECADDRELRAEIDALLATHHDTSSQDEGDLADETRERGPETGRLSGRTLGHYLIRERIGAGGMGEVYRARDEALERDVAIKILAAAAATDPAARSRLLREARAAAALNHPHVCTVHEVGETDGEAFIAMELIDGRPLDRLIAAGGLGLDEAVRYAIQIADALAHAHARGLLHRDLKAANVLIAAGGWAKVVDFGLAKRMKRDLPAAETRSDSLTRPGRVAGTVAYMAPERLRGQEADARSDVWALGIILYEMVTGQRPFRGRTPYELSSAIFEQPPAPPPSALPAGVQSVIDRCLAKDPEQRPQRAADVRAALEAGQTVSADARAAGATTPRGRRWWAAAAAMGVLAAALAIVRSHRAAPAAPAAPGPGITSLAVLPLRNLSGDAEQEYLADGITEEVIAEISKISALRVISRTSAMRYKQTDKPLPQIARELGVEGVIEGSMARQGDEVRITVQLLEGRTDRHLWAQTYQREMRGVMAVTGEIARAVAREVRARITPDEEERLAARPAVNPDAYQAYLTGRIHWYELTPKGLDAAQRYFELALKKDPGYAEAEAGIGATWIGRAHMGYARPREAFPVARDAARRALALDETIAEAHATLASVAAFYEWDWRSADRELQRAVELNPHCAEWHLMYFNPLAEKLRPGVRLAEMRRCAQDDPLNLFYQAGIAIHLFLSRNYEASIAQFRGTLAADPQFFLAHNVLWEVLHDTGRYPEALAEARKNFALIGDEEVLRAIEAGAAAGGYPEAMRRAARTLAERARVSYVEPVAVAQLYTFAGEKERALDWLEKAYDERDSQLVYLGVVPDWDILRGDPRFQVLLRRMNYPL